MDKERFQALVEEAVAGIPRKFKKYLRNVAVIVEDRPPRGSRLLGLYHGVPFQYRGPYYGNIPPDVIVIYQDPIEQICRSDDEVRDKVEEVVLHEIGHYFGLDEKTLRRIESKR